MDARALVDPRPVWNAAWQALGVADPGDAAYRVLIDRWREPHRGYHTVQHLEECLALFAEHPHLAEHPAEVALALFFHDAIYDPRAHDNEEKSAVLAAAALSTAGAGEAAIGRVRALILATRHQAPPETPDAALLVDIDLAILGAGEARFAEYERQVREEYAFVPGFLFRGKRREILRSFLERSRLYHTDPFRALFEEKARANLRKATA